MSSQPKCNANNDSNNRGNGKKHHVAERTRQPRDYFEISRQIVLKSGAVVMQNFCDEMLNASGVSRAFILQVNA